MTNLPGHDSPSVLIRRLAACRVLVASTKRTSPPSSTSPRTLRMQKGRRARELRKRSVHIGQLLGRKEDSHSTSESRRDTHSIRRPETSFKRQRATPPYWA